VRSGELALAPRLRVAPPPKHARAAVVPAVEPLPAYSRWEDLHLSLADGLTLRVGVGRARVRRSYIDLGMAHRTTRDPRAPWRLVVAVCHGYGTFRWKDFGSYDAVKVLVSETSKLLRAAFALDDLPFTPIRGGGWRSKYRASPGDDAPDSEAGGNS
jgi:hypothetical protein